MSPAQDRTPPEGRPLRPAPTTHVFRTGDDLVIYAGGDDFIVPDLEQDQLEALHALVEGRLPPEQCTAFEPEVLRSLLAELTEEGVLAGPEEGPDSRGRTVSVLGDNPLAETVRTLFGQAGVEDVGPGSADAVVACTGWLTDRAWCDLDAKLHEAGTPWHRAYGDGLSFFLGPLTLPGSSAGYRDTRRRLLAATDADDLLAGLWAHWDTTRNPYPWPDPGVLAVTAGTLVADTLALFSGAPVAATRHQTQVRCSDLYRTHHPVLPVPGGPTFSGQVNR
ncbi:hypothetical protein NE857_17940 [Nocardiopsis exhalans]|uniref:Uncharacterized protein n=1 Tax=Nocardiopsis exhalans TaxID=163604 RepID=A0ABY5CZC8_9ACTN|nr:hypothetical protein [Nocardiopsis exhalans]USY17236.1 hypothetical protein NE857_17940 [Nocardiopsis exhalans]